MGKHGVTYDGSEAPPPRRDFEPYPQLVGWSGPVLVALSGYRGPYRPRKPVLLEHLMAAALANEAATVAKADRRRGKRPRLTAAGPGEKSDMPDDSATVFGDVTTYDGPPDGPDALDDTLIPVSLDDEPAPDTDRCPSSGLEDLQRHPVPVTDAASGVQLVVRRTRKHGPRPPQACVVCKRSFTARSATQVCCDRKCGGVYRSDKREAAEVARRAATNARFWPRREVGT